VITILLSTGLSMIVTMKEVVIQIDAHGASTTSMAATLSYAVLSGISAGDSRIAKAAVVIYLCRRCLTSHLDSKVL
jgi:hypothetical protein